MRVNMNPIISEVLSNKQCKECILSKSKEHILVRNKTIKINGNYAPRKTKILFVAESPPMAFLKDLSRYFYALGKVKRNVLFYHMMSVLFEREMKNFKNYSKEYFLNKFKKNGFYLIDMAKCPINRLPNETKRKAIESCARYLNEELHTLDFEKAVFIGKGSFEKVKNRLDLDLDYDVVPFPRFKQNVLNFKRELKRILKRAFNPKISENK